MSVVRVSGAVVGGQESSDIPILQVHLSHLRGCCEAEGCEMFCEQLGSAL